MKLSSLLTSLGINIFIFIGLFLFTLFSILRKQPTLTNVYFGGQSLISMPQSNKYFVRFVLSVSWILKVWKPHGEEIFKIGGLDAYVFIHFIMFGWVFHSLRIFFIASILVALLLYPVTYSIGCERDNDVYVYGSMDVLSINYIKKVSRWYVLYIVYVCLDAYLLIMHHLNWLLN